MSPPSVAASRLNVALLVVAAACWGTGTVVSKQAVAEIPPLSLLAIQLAFSVAFLTLVARVRGVPRPTGRDGRILARLGILNPGLAYALSLVGLTEISASLSVLLWAAEPILILVLAAVVLGERTGRRVLGASAIAVLGFGLVVFDPGARGSLLGVALTLAGVGVCGVYSVVARRWLPGSADSTLSVVLAQQAHALAVAVAAVAVLAIGGVAAMPRVPGAGALVSAAASGLLYYAFAHLAYLAALRAVPATIAAASFYLIPVFGVALGLLAGERLLPLQWLGAAIVVVSVAVITTRAARPTAATQGASADQPSSAAASAQMASTPSAAKRS